jgi:hypothetical protein
MNFTYQNEPSSINEPSPLKFGLKISDKNNWRNYLVNGFNNG